MKILRIIFLLPALILWMPSCIDSASDSPTVMSGNYWKEQALKGIMPYWTKYSRDTAYGGFHTNLDSEWEPFGSSYKYPSMISRHLFSYSAAYLLSGEEEYIRQADSTVEWLIGKAWDKEYGGWYDELDREGKPVQTTKTTFVQVYAVTGLAMYYFVTRDSTALSYIIKSNDLLEAKAWDRSTGGYFDMMNRDWTISESNKSFSSVITPVSGYLFYLYHATRDSKLSEQISRILEVTMNKMADSQSGWILESFNRNWEYLPAKDDLSEINTGHNIEAAWMLIKDYLLTGNESRLNSAVRLAGMVHEAGLFNSRNIWLSTVSRSEPFRTAPFSYWWIQAYGNMFSLYLYHVTDETKYLDDFEQGAMAWSEGFLDRKNGDTYLSTDSLGKGIDGTKANRFKTSYHSIEHCLLNYLMLNLWVNNEPAGIYFRINSSEKGDVLYTSLLEDDNIKVTEVSLPGNDQAVFRIENSAVHLPPLKYQKIKVILSRLM
ncbi:MAG: AGE family epimerase/isomerase [Bacteroidales bacterium]|jgi:mannobiose 2-epimerase|nr:AGE family epimerase/isomerase [Bacteroidales bacterium]